MKILTDEGVNYLVEKIKANILDFVSASTITRIEVVDTLPETEEEGVLYLVKEIITDDTGGETVVVNLYYQDEDKEYSSSSGYSVNTRTDGTVEITSNGELTGEKDRTSNDFVLSVEAGKTYKFTAEYVSGSATTSSDTIMKFYIIDDSTGTTIVSKSISEVEDVEVTFTASETVTYSQARARFYLYIGASFTDLVYKLSLVEV